MTKQRLLKLPIEYSERIRSGNADKYSLNNSDNKVETSLGDRNEAEGKNDQKRQEGFIIINER